MAVVFGAVMARAGGVEPGEEPPGELRVLTFYDATTTSKCIGNPVTPLCAVETVEACFWRRNARFCAAAGYPIPTWRSPVTERGRQESLRYKVADIKTLTDAAVPSDRPERDAGAWQAGDVKVVLRLQYCHPSSPPPSYCMGWDKSPITYFVRKRGGRWIYIDRLVPRVDR